uniref:Uncharacterized protein n=1 Tax=Arundo donax TaxID=35708 RepID=A0A0A9GAM2_ARUDO
MIAHPALVEHCLFPLLFLYFLMNVTNQSKTKEHQSRSLIEHTFIRAG